MHLAPLSPELGAVISDIDLSRNLSSTIADQLYDHLTKYKVIFLRNQLLTPQDHLDLANLFGEISGPHPVYPGIPGYDRVLELRNDADNPPDTDGWHADLTYTAAPPIASVLVARQLPDTGGDTLWTDMHAVFNSLGDGMKADLRCLRAVHDLGDFRNAFVDEHGTDLGLSQAVADIGCAVHEVVKIHPTTKQECLFVNEAFTAHILGKTARQSRNLLSFLYDHMLKPEFQIRWQWRLGDVAIWDNRSTQHYATADYLPAARCMHRVTIVSDYRSS